MSTTTGQQTTVAWTGTVAFLDTDTIDGRRIASLGDGKELRTRPDMPPLTYKANAAEPGHAGARLAGWVQFVWLEGNQLHAEGISDDPELCARLATGEEVACGVELDDVTMSLIGEDGNPHQVSVAADWRLIGLCAYGPGGQSSFPDAKISRKPDQCPDCCVPPGSPHLDIGCDVEHCASTGRQRTSCGCDDDQPTVWSGEHPARVAALRYGFYLPDDGSGLPRELDFNRVFRELRWDRVAGAFLSDEGRGEPAAT